MANPHVPAVHMNTRFLTTTKRWFGGGADLNPAIPYAEDTDAFHARLRAACAAHDPTFYPRFSKWAEEYFWLPHRDVARGVGGIFYDHLEGHFDAHFAFTRDVGEAFLDIFPQIVRKRMEHAIHRRRPGAPARISRPLRRVQPALRPRHLVRPQDRRQHRRDPDEPAPAGEVEMSYEPVPDGELAAVVTFLEMRAAAAGSRRRLRRCAAPRRPSPTSTHYRALFRQRRRAAGCGSRAWSMDDAELAAIIDDPEVELFAVVDGRSRKSACSSSISARPANASSPSSAWSRSLPARATAAGCSPRPLRLAWRDGVRRVHVHTCTLDHPAALAAYQRAGFTAYKRAVERFPDPRLLGLLPADCAPQVPLLGTLASAAVARQLNVNPRQHHHQQHRDGRADDLGDQRDQQRRRRVIGSTPPKISLARMPTDHADRRDDDQRADQEDQEKAEQPPPMAAGQLPAAPEDRRAARPSRRWRPARSSASAPRR